MVSVSRFYSDVSNKRVSENNKHGGSDKACSWKKILKMNKICCTLIKNFRVETLKGWREKNNRKWGDNFRIQMLLVCHKIRISGTRTSFILSLATLQGGQNILSWPETPHSLLFSARNLLSCTYSSLYRLHDRKRIIFRLIVFIAICVMILTYLFQI